MAASVLITEITHGLPEGKLWDAWVGRSCDGLVDLAIEQTSGAKINIKNTKKHISKTTVENYGELLHHQFGMVETLWKNRVNRAALHAPMRT